MSKKHNYKPPPPPANSVPPDEPKTPKHRQCPVCYGGQGGVGKPSWWRRISGTLVRRRYVCDKCGFDWTADVRTHSEVLKIEYQHIDIQHHPIEDLEER